MKFNIQRSSVKLYLAVSIMLFIYSLGFFTNFNFTSSASEEFYQLAQDTNRFIFNFAFFNIVCAGILIGLDNHTKERYRVTNFVGSVVSIVLIAITAILSFLKIMQVKSDFLQLDYELIRVFDVTFEPSTFVFEFGYVICSILAIVFILNLVVLIFKIRQRYSKVS